MVPYWDRTLRHVHDQDHDKTTSTNQILAMTPE